MHENNHSIDENLSDPLFTLTTGQLFHSNTIACKENNALMEEPQKKTMLWTTECAMFLNSQKLIKGKSLNLHNGYFEERDFSY